VTPYEVRMKKSALRELEELPKSALQKALAALHELKEQPRPRGSKKLVGSESSYRIRIADYRIIYEVDADKHVIFITRVRHRKEAYD